MEIMKGATTEKSTELGKSGEVAGPVEQLEINLNNTRVRIGNLWVEIRAFDELVE